MTGTATADPEGVVLVAQFRDMSRAHLCVMALEAGGVKAWLSQAHVAGVSPDLGIALGIDVMVAASDAAAARDLMAAFESGEVALPADTEVCKRCGSSEVQHVAKPQRAAAILGTLLAGLPRPDVAWVWKCSRCGNEWQ